MTTQSISLQDLLAADAARRAAASAPAEGSDALAEHHRLDALRFRLVNGFPRETKAVFAGLRATLAPYGYQLSPLHPGHDLTQPRMQTELMRTDGSQFAPLVFELERDTGRVRVFVRQFGGRAVAEFAERWIDIENIDVSAMDGILQDYVTCMLRPLQERLAA